MSRTRLAIELIDADGCTFNKNHRYRILYFIQRYQKILEEYGPKSSFTIGEKELLKIFIDSVIQDQTSMVVNEGGLNGLTEYALTAAQANYLKQLQINGFTGEQLNIELTKISNNDLVNQFIYQNIEYMENVCPSVLRKIFVLANKFLIKRIIKHANSHDLTIVMLGSNRQFYACDRYNMQDKGTSSIYNEISYFVDHINASLTLNKVKLDKFTVGDLYESGEFKPGTNFKKIKRGAESYVRNPFDKNKINIMYPIFHYIAKKYPEFQRHFYLYDDQPSILSNLKIFFSRVDNGLIAKDDVFEMQRYNGKFYSATSIIGTGVIDYNFEKNTRIMANLSGYDPVIDNNLNIVESLNVYKFLQERVTGWECVPYDELTLFKKNKRKSREKLVGSLALK